MNRIIVFIIVISRRLTAERPVAVNYHLNRTGTLITRYLKRLIDINGIRIHGFGRLAVCGFNTHPPGPRQNPYIRPKRVRRVNCSRKNTVECIEYTDRRLRFELHTTLYNRI